MLLFCNHKNMHSSLLHLWKAGVLNIFSKFLPKRRKLGFIFHTNICGKWVERAISYV